MPLSLIALAMLTPATLAATDGREATGALEPAALAAPVAPGPDGELPEGWTDARGGPLGPADRALIEGVRRADLWEGPAGQMAAQKGVNTRVREIGTMISQQHLAELDPEVRKVGAQLGITLPVQPNEQQQGWLAELEQASGSEFDRIFVDRLRAAHAGVFSLIATVRANTRNAIVRDFAQMANRYVDGHIEMLDSTGLVAFNQLPTPAAPQPPGAGGRAAGAGLAQSTGAGAGSVAVWFVLFVAAVAGATTLMRVVRPR